MMSTLDAVAVATIGLTQSRISEKMLLNVSSKRVNEYTKFIVWMSCLEVGGYGALAKNQASPVKKLFYA